MTFNVSNNALGDAGLKPILDSFKERSVLRYLDIANTGITANTMDELAHLLGVCPELETLQVDGNTIGFEGINLLGAPSPTLPRAVRHSWHACHCGIPVPLIVSPSGRKMCAVCPPPRGMGG